MLNTTGRALPSHGMLRFIALGALALILAVGAWGLASRFSSDEATIRGPDLVLVSPATSIVAEMSADVERTIVAPALVNFGEVATITATETGSWLGIGNNVANLPTPVQIGLFLIAVIVIASIYQRCVGAKTDVETIGGAVFRHSLKTIGLATIAVGIVLAAAFSNSSTAFAGNGGYLGQDGAGFPLWTLIALVLSSLVLIAGGVVARRVAK
ncbi:MAG: hypothetical protein Q8P13_00600 [bacterium]|nr:hypothetical protein [bacterium]